MDRWTPLRLAPPLLASAAVLLPPPCARAQTVVVRGRVEDAVSRAPLPDVTVFSADSSRADVTDAGGGFTLTLPGDAPLTVLVERIGYVTSRYELPRAATSRRAVLLLEPAPIEVKGIEVIGESAVAEVLGDLERRRRAFPWSVQAFDRARLERVAPAGSVWDFVRRRAWAIFECGSSASGLCYHERGRRSVREGPRRLPVEVCLDGRPSWGAVAELSTLDADAVALVEIYDSGRRGVRVYTPGYVTSGARRGRNIARPLMFGC